jgi:hypothetical protein
MTWREGVFLVLTAAEAGSHLVQLNRFGFEVRNAMVVGKAGNIY